MDKHKLGRLGESKASEYLLKNGYKIVDRNFRCFLGEIDIIGEKDEEIIFIEVKTRLSQNYGKPKESVNLNKQKKIIKIAQFYLQSNYKKTYQPRFDVIEVYIQDVKELKYNLEHIKGAF